MTGDIMFLTRHKFDYSDENLNPASNSILVRYINKIIYDSPKNVIIVAVGRPGTGKSLGVGVKLLSVLNPELVRNMKASDLLNKRLAFNSQRFVEIIQNETSKKGDVVIFDEPQISISNRSWYTESSKAMNAVLQTFRHRQLVTIFCTPSLSFIDSQVRKLVDLFITPYSMNQDEGWIKCKVYKFKYNVLKDEYYPARIKFIDVDGGIKDLSEVTMFKVSDELAQAYKDLSVDFKKDVAETARKKVSGEIAKNLIKPELSNIQMLILKHKFSNRMSGTEIADELGLPHSIIKSEIRKMKSKGVKLTKQTFQLCYPELQKKDD